MKERPEKRIGFACAYTPLPLIAAAGFAPYRVLPLGDSPEQAGGWLHDNVCPHVKRILDRALAGDVPPLEGVVFMDSCDAMRRLADAWRRIRPAERVLLLDLPTAADEPAAAHLAAGFRLLAETLREWGGDEVAPASLAARIGEHHELAGLFAGAARRLGAGGRARLQRLYNRAAAGETAAVAAELKQLADAAGEVAGPPIYLFGNVTADPEIFELFERAGARIVAEDSCTGSRMFSEIALDPAGDAFLQLARGVLDRPPCARTMRPSEPGYFARFVAEAAEAAGARGAIAHVMKFCDPYLARLPSTRRALADKGLPLLVLEGDCTVRSLGQHATRIEAFVEMLGEE